MKCLNLLGFFKIERNNFNFCFLFYLICVLSFAKCQNSKSQKCELNRNRPLDTDEAVLFIEDIATDVIVKVTSKGNIIGKIPVAGCMASIAVSVSHPPIQDISDSIGVWLPTYAVPETFLPLPQLIADMSKTQKQILTDRIECIMQEIVVTDFAAFVVQVTNSSTLRDRVIQVVKEYIQQELQLIIS